MRCAGDRERGERSRLDAQVLRLPADRVTPAVEERVVAEDTPGHASHPRIREPTREPVEVAFVEGRVPVSDEEQISLPGPARAGPLADELGSEPEVRAENVQSRERDGQLLGGRGKQAAPAVQAVDRLSGAEVDGDCGGLSRRDSGRSQCAVQREIERGRGRARRGRGDQRERCRRDGEHQGDGSHE
jgi:hypothetical protein